MPTVDFSSLSESDVGAKRHCVVCSTEYSIADYRSEDRYLFGPEKYAQGCVTHCLACWLGVGPDSDAELGNVLRDVAGKLGPTTHLVVMPITRIELEDPIKLTEGIVFYPGGSIDLTGVQIAPPDRKSTSLAMFQSASSGVDLKTICQQTTVAFAATFDWQEMTKASHSSHMELLRNLSEWVDEVCLNVVRFRHCSLTRVDALPGRAGQLASNPMMAGVVLYNAGRREGQVIGGSAFTHVIVQGLGLDLTQLADAEFPLDGGVGWIARRALAQYRMALESGDQTTKFVHAVALLDFLAAPSDYIKSVEIAKVIARYVAKNRTEYEKFRERFMELHGKKSGNVHEGLRTRIVHLGERLEHIMPDASERVALFRELDSYIGCVLDHMIKHSFWEWEEYENLRRTLGPFANNNP